MRERHGTTQQLACRDGCRRSCLHRRLRVEQGSRGGQGRHHRAAGRNFRGGQVQALHALGVADESATLMGALQLRKHAVPVITALLVRGSHANTREHCGLIIG